MSKKKEPRSYNCLICNDPCISRDIRSKLCKKKECATEHMRQNYHKTLHKLSCKKCEKDFDGKYKEWLCPVCKELPRSLNLEKFERIVLCKHCNVKMGTEVKKKTAGASTEPVHGDIVCVSCKEESRKKLSEDRLGEKNVNWGKRGTLSKNWKGGKNLMKLLRSAIHKDWVLPILIRDNFTCRCCRKNNLKKNTILHVHHIGIDFKDIVAKCLRNGLELKSLNENQIETLRNDILKYHLDNNIQGLTLCLDCHSLIHSSKKLRNATIYSGNDTVLWAKLDRETLEAIIINGGEQILSGVVKDNILTH
jgi:hypothetical protein